jgi:malate dehydrogenase (oxaloacetate-decarboxylating)(NADP+)
VAREPITDWDAYRAGLRQRLGIDNTLVMYLRNKSAAQPKRVVFAEANNFRILKAVETVLGDNMAHPVLIGNREIIEGLIRENSLHIPNPEIVDLYAPETASLREEFAQKLYDKRKRKGMTHEDATEMMMNRDYFGAMMVETGMADAFLSGFSRNYPNTIRPALHCIGVDENCKRIAGMYVIMTKRGPLFLADTTVNVQPDARALVDIAKMAAREIRHFGIEPVMAFASFSNLGSYRGPGEHAHVWEAVQILHRELPDLLVDGEMQANIIFDEALRNEKYPFTRLGNRQVNAIIFPDLNSGNILYKTLQSLSGYEAIGPILMGMKKPVHILQMDSTVREIVNMTAIAVIDAQEKG